MSKKKIPGRKSRLLKICRSLVYPAAAAAVLIFLLIQAAGPDASDKSASAPVSLLMTDFTSDAEDSDLAVLLKPVLHTALQQSDRLNLFPELKIRNFLKQNYEDPPARVSRNVAERICRVEGIRTILIPGIEQLNGSMVISARILHLDENTESFADTVRIYGEDHLAAAIEELSGRIRLKLGEGIDSAAMQGRIFPRDTTFRTLKLFSHSLPFYSYRSRRDLMADLQEILQEDPDMAVAYLFLGSHYLRLQQHSNALSCIAKAKTMSGDLPLKYRLLIEGTHDILLRRYVKAYEHFLSFAKAFPSDWQAHSLSAECAAALGNYSTAADEYQKAIELDDTQIEPYLGLCMALIYDGDPLEASKILDRAAALEQHNPEVAIFRGLLELFNNNPRFAIQEFEKAKQSPSYRFRGTFLQAQAKIYEGKFRDALRTLSDGIEEEGQNRDIAAEAAKKLARAQIYLATGNIQAAAAEANGITGTVEDPVFMAQLGSILLSSGQISSAEKILSWFRSTDSDPFVQAIGEGLQGEVLAAGGRMQEAIELFLGTKKNLNAPSISLARLFMNTEQWGAAAAEFNDIQQRKAVMLFPFHKPWFTAIWVRALYDAGQCSLKSGNSEEAKQYFRQYLWIMENADSGLDEPKEAEILLTGRPLRKTNQND